MIWRLKFEKNINKPAELLMRCVCDDIRNLYLCCDDRFTLLTECLSMSHNVFILFRKSVYAVSRCSSGSLFFTHRTTHTYARYANEIVVLQSKLPAWLPRSATAGKRICQNFLMVVGVFFFSQFIYWRQAALIMVFFCQV